jgi:SAM-dependent methyltransferase
MSESEFRRDLYRGTAGYYDRFRVPYPAELIDDLAARCGADGTGKLLDLACGTGQISFALHGRFEEVWAVDQEAEMIDVVWAKAAAAGIGNIRLVTSAAEELSAPPGTFDLVAIGNAFHRLRRDAVAARILDWLRPGGFLALLWSDSPWVGEAPWQEALRATMRRWETRAKTRSRIPAGHEADRRERPDLRVLGESGFEAIGSFEFSATHEWSMEALAGFVSSTSVLSRAALGALAAEFDADLRRELLSCESAGRFPQTISFACNLARRPAG